jgi:hypothetical protein
VAGSADAFEANRIDVNQVLAVKTTPHGTSEMPGTRNHAQPVYQARTVEDHRNHIHADDRQTLATSN